MTNSSSPSLNSSEAPITGGVNNSNEDVQLVSDTFGYVVMIVAALGLLGNVLILAVFHRKAFRGWSSTVYLRSLAVVDSIILVGFCVAIDPTLRSAVCDHPFPCYLHDYVGNVLVDQGVWILVLFTGERLVAVVRPYEAKLWLTARRSVLALAVTFVVLAVINSHDLWLMNRSQCIGCLIFYPDGDGFQEFFMHLNTLKAFAFPVPFLIISCIIIIVHVKRSKTKREQYARAQFTGDVRKKRNQEMERNHQAQVPVTELTPPEGPVFTTNAAGVNKKNASENGQGNQIRIIGTSGGLPRTTARVEIKPRKDSGGRSMVLTLIAVNLLFVVTRLPSHVYKFYSTNESSAEMFMIKSILYSLIMLDHTLNIVLYAGTGSKFRSEFAAMFKNVMKMCKAK